MRMSFFGGGTDVPPFSDIYGGEVLFSTINRYAYCEIESISENRILLGDEEEVYVKSDKCYIGKYGMIKAVLSRVIIEKGCKIDIYSDTLPGSGLGGSSAQIAAIVKACYGWNGKEISKEKLAYISYCIERNVMKIKGGFQDPIATVYGGIGYMKAHTIEDFRVESLGLGNEIKEKLRNSILLYNTGYQHNSSDIIAAQMKVQEKKKEVSEQNLKKMKELAILGKKVILAGDIDMFGRMLHESWIYKKMMSEQITTPYIEELYDKAKKAGALGGKILGAGGGGYLILVCEEDKKKRIKEAFKGCQGTFEESWTFDELGARFE